jgi:hypothetical protein
MIRTPTAPEIAEEVSRLVGAQTNVDAAIAALMDGTLYCYYDKHPELQGAITAGLASAMGVTTGGTPVPDEEGRRKKSRKTDVQRLVSTAGERAELFHDREQRAFATYERAGHRETWIINSAPCRGWLGGIAMHELSIVPTKYVLEEAVAQLAALAVHDKPELKVAGRIAWSDSSIVIDLADEQWRAVLITRDGWHVIPSADAPVRMMRMRSMLSLPEPQRGGSLDELRALVSIGTEEDWARVRGWIVGAFLPPPGTFALLALAAERGSGKSTTARRIASLVDPRKAQLMSPPRDLRDLDVAAASRRVFVIDNLSSIPTMLSDRLCTMLSGGGWVARELYSDSTEVALDVRVPGITTSIGRVVVRDDLSDRALVVECPAIPADRRRTEQELDQEWRTAQPRILGALYDAVACALRRSGEVQLERLPRLADHARWVEAAGPALGAEPGTYVTTIESAQERADAESLSDDPVGAALLAHVERCPDEHWSGNFKGFAGLLLNGAERPEGWPSSPRGMSSKLKRLAPALRRIGAVAEVGEPSGHARTRTWTVKTPARPPASPATSASPGEMADSAIDRRRSQTVDQGVEATPSPSTAPGGIPRRAVDADDADGHPTDSPDELTIELDGAIGHPESQS